MSTTALPVLQKPPFGEPCNGCGECCKEYLCLLGREVFERNEGPCPGLEAEEDGIYMCGLVLHPARYAPTQVALRSEEELKEAATLLIGSGWGCDCRSYDEPDNLHYKQFLHDSVGQRLTQILLALFVWVNKGGK